MVNQVRGSGALKWANLSRATWFSPFLRMLPKEARLLYADLAASCDEDGVMPSDDAGLSVAFGVSADELARLLAGLIGIGLLIRSEDGRIVVLDTAKSSSTRKSRVAGGKASQALQRAQKADVAQHDAQQPCSATHSSSSSSSSDSDSEERKSAGKGRSKKARIDPATHPLPPVLDHPDVRKALADYLATRKGGAWDEVLARVRIEQMAGWGRERSVAALRASVGYQGLFEPRGASVQPRASQVPQGASPGMSAERTAEYLRELRETPRGGPPKPMLELLRNVTQRNTAEVV